MNRPTVLIYLCLFPIATFSGQQSNLLTMTPPLPHCGEIESLPFARSGDTGPRVCPPVTSRKYVHHNKGLGFDILDSESEACFVPDQAYRTLDDIIDAVKSAVKYDSSLTDPPAELDQARMISATISHELTNGGFGLYIPTDTLGDALVDRNQPNEPERHEFDCDTGSFIFITVASNLGATTALVDIPLPSGNGHNYVQWLLDKRGTSMNWDTNQQGECRTPEALPAYAGKPMSARQTQGYAISLRAPLWVSRGLFDRAIADYHEATQLYSEAPTSFNNFAWMIATKDFPARQTYVAQALTSAQHAISITRTGNYMDTLACVYALLGDFKHALATESQAIQLGGNTAFDVRLAHFHANQNCTGDE